MSNEDQMDPMSQAFEVHERGGEQALEKLFDSWGMGKSDASRIVTDDDRR
jgi:hypothetical protein